MWGCHGRFIVPTAVLRRLADDDSIPAESRQALLDSAAVESAWRELRRAHSEATQSTLLARGIASLRLAGVLAPGAGGHGLRLQEHPITARHARRESG